MAGSAGMLNVSSSNMFDLKEIGIFNKDASFWNMQKMQTLVLGGIGQLDKKYEREINSLKQELKELKAKKVN